MRRAAVLGLLLTFAGGIAAAQDIFAGRPAFSPAEQPAEAPAECRDIRRMSAGMPEPESRIDLAVIGELTTVRTDGALWYLLMCADVRVLCVTYESNGMQAGERVVLKGGYIRRDANHIQLDPCLANRAETSGNAAK